MQETPPETPPEAATQPQPDAQVATQDSFFTPESAPLTEVNNQTISWTASEFIAHHKTASWYVKLAGAAVVITALIYLVTRDVISSAVVLIAAAILGFYAARQPRELPYELNTGGLRIGERFYAIDMFRSFAIVPEGAFLSIVFMPLKRFAPLTTIYFSPDDEERIVDLLSAILPLAEHRHDPIDQLMRRIRF